MATAVEINGIDKQAVEAVEATILSILNSKSNEKTKQVALGILPKIVSKDIDATFYSCNFGAIEEEEIVEEDVHD